MGLKEHKIIKRKCYDIYMSHTGQILGYNCKKNIKTIENYGEWTKSKQKYWQRYTGKNVQKMQANHRHRQKNVWKNTRLTSI